MAYFRKLLSTCAILILASTINMLNADQKIPTNTGKLFEDKPNAHLYWQALLQAAHKDKAAALKTVAQIKDWIPDPFRCFDPSANSGLSMSAAQGERFWDDNKDTAIAGQARESAGRDDNIDNVFDTLFLSKMYRNPEALTYRGLFESIGIYDHNAYLNDVSPDAIIADLEETKQNLKLLQNCSLDNASPEQKISYKIFLWKFKLSVNNEKFLFHNYQISHNYGIIFDITNLFTQIHPLKTPEDVELYVTRLSKIPEQFEQTITLLEHQKNLGVIPPAFTLSKIISMMQKITPRTIEENIFYSHLAKNIETIGITNKEEVLAKATNIIQTLVYPAYQKLQDYLKNMLSQTTANNGVWALPDGDEYYAFLLKHQTSTNLSADQIHNLGLQEVHRIQEEMRTIFVQAGLEDKEKTVALQMQELSKNPQFFYPETEEGRQQCLTDFGTILERSRKELYPLFYLKPQSPVKIQAVPQHEEEGAAPAFYRRQNIDGSRPGVFFVNLRSSHENPKFEMETLTVHEAEPGHHFQISLQQESTLPIMRQLNGDNAYTEGWALYAEKLAYEQNFYSSCFTRLGHLQWELVRAVRLVVDTGIHKKRWSLEEAIDYMGKNTGMPKTTVVSEIERYFVSPGQACSYKIGQLKILELRQRAKDALGTKFDIREFHNVVLEIGATPLVILEEVVDQYIFDKKTEGLK
ncbi:MAG: DUF885 domain-containing protein [bacterium]